MAILLLDITSRPSLVSTRRLLTRQKRHLPKLLDSPHLLQVRKRLCVATAAISSSRGSTAVAKVASAGAFFPNSDGSNVTASQDKAPSKGTSSTVDETLALDLDFKAQLTWQQEVLSLAIPALVCGLIYATTAPGAFSWLYAASMAAAYASMVYGIRSRLEEDLFKVNC